MYFCAAQYDMWTISPRPAETIRCAASWLATNTGRTPADSVTSQRQRGPPQAEVTRMSSSSDFSVNRTTLPGFAWKLAFTLNHLTN